MGGDRVQSAVHFGGVKNYDRWRENHFGLPVINAHHGFWFVIKLPAAEQLSFICVCAELTALIINPFLIHEAGPAD